MEINTGKPLILSFLSTFLLSTSERERARDLNRTCGPEGHTLSPLGRVLIPGEAQEWEPQSWEQPNRKRSKPRQKSGQRPKTANTAAVLPPGRTQSEGETRKPV